MKTKLLPLIALLLAPLATLQAADRLNPSPEQLEQYLRQYPDADLNKDGKLSMDEARAYLKKIRGGKSGKAAKAGKSGATAQAAPAGPEPALADVHYGPHERNVLDFWKATSDQPAPLVIFIHGGGFVAGDKSKARGDRLLPACLDAGVSFAAINYRYRTTTPIQDVLHDCARAIQFIRSQAAAWNVDKTRIASYGGSAGAGSSLWLAFHDDLADPQNTDPVLRESSRLVCAGANACQFSYDVTKWSDLFGDQNRKFGDPESSWPAFYGLKTLDELRGPLGRKYCADCDMRGLISKDDPPVFLSSPMPGGDITNRGHLLHHPKHAKAIYDRCRELGVGVVAQIPAFDLKPGLKDPQNLQEFLFQHLNVGTAPAKSAEARPAP